MLQKLILPSQGLHGKICDGIWEQCEGFLFGPVEDNDYDPNMDSWPTDYVQMDSLLASNSNLSVANIQNLTLSLRDTIPSSILYLATMAAEPGSYGYTILVYDASSYVAGFRHCFSYELVVDKKGNKRRDVAMVLHQSN